jgi:hypothetical protein
VRDPEGEGCEVPVRSIHTRFNIPLQAPVYGLPRTRAVYQQGKSPSTSQQTGVPLRGAARVE